MSEEQAKKKGCYRCMSSDDLYEKLDGISEELCVSKRLDWQKEICMSKKNFLQLAREWGLVLFPPYSTFLESIEGDHIWLIGFGG